MCVRHRHVDQTVDAVTLAIMPFAAVYQVTLAPHHNAALNVS